MLEGQRRLALHQGKFAPDPGRTPLGQTAGLLSAWHDSGQERFRLFTAKTRMDAGEVMVGYEVS